MLSVMRSQPQNLVYLVPSVSAMRGMLAMIPAVSTSFFNMH